MILVDASVLFDHLQNRDPKLLGHFTFYPVALGGVTRSEVLHGARSAADRQKLMTFLARFGHAQTVEAIWACSRRQPCHTAFPRCYSSIHGCSSCYHRYSSRSGSLGTRPPLSAHAEMAPRPQAVPRTAVIKPSTPNSAFPSFACGRSCRTSAASP